MKNREIKFRVWDCEFKFYVSSLFAISENGEYLDSNWDEGLNCYVYSSSFTESERYTIQQFTGLKDKTGREIYEGDILDMFNVSLSDSYKLEENFKFRGFIQFDGFCCYEFITCVPYAGIEPQTVALKPSFDRGFYENAKVIGNLFESPELLKQN